MTSFWKLRLHTYDPKTENLFLYFAKKPKTYFVCTLHVQYIVCGTYLQCVRPQQHSEDMCSLRILHKSIFWLVFEYTYIHVLGASIFARSKIMACNTSGDDFIHLKTFHVKSRVILWNYSPFGSCSWKKYVKIFIF